MWVATRRIGYERQIELIEVINDYDRIAIGRDLVIAALIVAGAVAGLFFVPGALVLGGAFSVWAFIRFKILCCNIRHIENLAFLANIEKNGGKIPL